MKDFNCEKPFSCDTPGCLLKFSAEDLLTAHKKRHDINLTINNKCNGFADQTPTPTRFIRNCEEVGLFQDLQNVNPFEETFRKAVEAVHQGQTIILGKPDNINYVDDTLHTPNIFPLIQEVQIPKEVEQTQPAKEIKPIDPKSEQPKKIRKYRKRKYESLEIFQPTYVVPDKNVTFKLPIPKLSSNIKVFSPKYFSVLSKNVKNYCVTQDQPNVTKKTSKKSDLLEYNRQAQIRTRQKRKHYLGYLEDANKQLTEKLATLEKQLKRVLEENAILKTKVELFEEKTSIGFDMSTQTNPEPKSVDKKPPGGFQDHDYILPDPEERTLPGTIRKPFKKRSIQTKLCTNCNKNPAE